MNANADQGIATMFVGAFCWWMVFDWPGTARFLSPEDRIRVRRRLAADNQSNAAEEYDRRHIYAALKDWKCWGFAVIYMGCLMPLYAFSLFLPTILAAMGYAGTQAQLLSVPPYAVAAAMTIIVGWVGDRTRQRGILNMIVVVIGIIGFVMVSCEGTSRRQNVMLTIHVVDRNRRPTHPVRGHLPRRRWHLPYHPEHPLLVQQQHRRCIQARCDHRYCRWSWKRQRCRVVKHLPEGREAEILHWPRHHPGLHDSVPAWRHNLHVHRFEAREHKEEEWSQGQHARWQDCR
jgi:hypothetical protein